MRRESLFLLVIIPLAVEGYFDVQYIGSYVPLNEATTRNFCGEVHCLNDMSLLFESASQLPDAHPCIDFKEFTLGRLIKYRVVNERYKFRGLQNDVEERYKEKIRRILIEKSDPEIDPGPRVFRVIKNFFQKCVNQTHIHVQGKADMENYLNSLGSSQYMMRDSVHQWNASKFNFSKLFDAEPDHAVWVFFDHRIARCRHPDSRDRDIPCLKRHIGWKITATNTDDLIEMLLDMNDSFSIGLMKKRQLLAQIEKAIFYKSSFYRAKSIHEKVSRLTWTIMKIKNLQQLTKHFDINWLKAINDMFFNESQWTEEDEILVDDPELIENLAGVIRRTDPELLAETFMLTFLYNHQWVYNSYPFDRHFARNRGTSKAYQRWESCLFDINYKLSPALNLIYNQRNSNETFNEGAKNLTRYAIDECIRLIQVKTNFTSEMKDEITRRLKSLEIITGFNEQVLKINDLEKFYSYLPLNGNESYFDLWHETLRHIKRLENESADKWQLRVNKIAAAYITDILYDKLYIPAQWLLYPWFHPFRPKFFNAATILTKLIEVLLAHANKLAIENYGMRDEFLASVDADELAFEWYERWLEDGNVDLKYGANRLTDQQLYWFALARKFFVKTQKNFPQDVHPIGRLQSEYMHVLYKSKPGFQRVFNCSLNQNETEIFREYEDKLQSIYSNYY